MIDDIAPDRSDAAAACSSDGGPAAYDCEWSVVVIAAREDAAMLCSVIDAVLTAAHGHRTAVDVLVNGNQELSRKVATFVASKPTPAQPSARVRIWDIPLRDKAHAWNEYVHRIWPGSDRAFFLDGYAHAMPDAFRHLSETLRDRSDALAAAGGYRANARRARRPASGALSGNMHVLRGSTMTELRRRGIRLPLGFYWVDGLTGGILNFRFDPARNRWNTDNITWSPDASWTTPHKSAWRIDDLRDQFNRMKRQARGRVENLAVREHLAVRRRSPADFPVTSRELFVSWMRNHPFRMAWFAIKNPLVVDAIWQLRRPQDWSKRQLPPVLIANAEL
jgi:hypothetical protein